MDIRQDEQGQPPAPLDEVGERVAQRIEAKRQKWLSDLCEHPEQFRVIESRIHDQCGQIADEVTASLLAEASKSESFNAKKKWSWLRRLIRYVRPSRDR